MTNTLHVVLISAQTVPNITPILDQRFKPDKVIMLVSKSMQRQADQLQKIYTARGIKAERWPIDDAWDIEHIRCRVVALVAKHKDSNIALNATCGTKPMSIAAYEVFRQLEKPIFYVHPEKDRLIWMYPQNEPATDLADRIKLNEYFQAYGASHVNQGGQRKDFLLYRHLFNEIVNNISEFSTVLSSFNYYAANAKRASLRSPTLAAKDLKNAAFMRLLALFTGVGVLCEKNVQLEFASEAARFFVNGGWLEVYTFMCCFDLQESLGIHDLAHSVEVQRKQGTKSVLNELDVALLKDNRLYSIECKTRQFKGSHENDDASEVLYKLDSLRDLLGGIQAKTMLVSIKPLKSHHKDRASELNIETCCYEDLKNLPARITTWLDH
ncbi:MAG: DUF1887 family CARF protein [Methylococcales bacterium]